MHRFISSSFDFTQVKHSDVVYKVMEYVRRNFSRKISLDDIAGEVYLSRSYLSSLFKEEPDRALFAYINHVRIEKSKQMLLDDTPRSPTSPTSAASRTRAILPRSSKKRSVSPPKNTAIPAGAAFRLKERF